MPSYVSTISATGSTTGSADERAYVDRVVAGLQGDDRTYRDLEADLSSAASDAPAARIVVIVEDEDRHRGLYIVASGRVESYALERIKRTWHVTGHPELDSVLRAPPRQATPKPDAKASRNALELAAAAADEARTARDVPAMVALLDGADLRGTPGAKVRERLWSALIQNRALPYAAAARLVDGLRTEYDATARVIAGRMFLHDSLAPLLRDELVAAAAGLPTTQVWAARLCLALNNFDGIEYPPGFVASLPPALRRTLTTDPAAPPVATAPTRWTAPQLVRRIEAMLATADDGTLAGYREARDGAKYNAPDVRSAALLATRDRLLARARDGSDDYRASAIDVLDALGEPAVALVALCDRLSATAAGIRALRFAAGERVPEAARSPVPVSPPRHDWTAIGGAAMTAFGDLVVSRHHVLHLVHDGKRRWRFEAHGDPLLPYRVLGDPYGCVFVGSRYGLHALDAKTGRERWCAATVSPPPQQNVVDPPLQIWGNPSGLWVLGEDVLVQLDARDGRTLRVVAPPPFGTRSFVAAAGGALVTDGWGLPETLGASDVIPSGLRIGDDGSVTPVSATRLLSGIVREGHGIRVDVSSVDLMIESATGARRFALPVGGEVVLGAVGEIELVGGQPTLPIGVCVGVMGRQTWLRLEL